MNLQYTEKCSIPENGFFGEDQALMPLFEKDEEQTLEIWEQKRKILIEQWQKVIGEPSYTDYEKTTKVIEKFEHPEFYGTVCKQSVGPMNKQLVLIMEPKNPVKTPRPGAIVPFYWPDAMAGFDLAQKTPIEDGKNVQFGLHLVRQGYVAVCTEAFPFNTVPEFNDDKGLARWKVAAEKLLKENPGWTGIGKLIQDTSRGVDLLLSLENIDPERIVAVGHSLGGKMVFCTAAFDERIKCVIASDFGIGWSFTNWNDIWYYGKKINEKDFPLANHQLLALIAPRSFLLVAGLYDKTESLQYLSEAKKVYALYRRENRVGMFDHKSGHRPPEYAMDIAYKWLAEQFELPYREWNF